MEKNKHIHTHTCRQGTRHNATLFLALLLLVSCGGDPPVIAPATSKAPNLNENMINANRTIAQSEETAIDEYVARRKWPMTKLSGGARIWEYERGNGDKVEIEDSLSIHYDIEAINGKTIYTNIDEKYVVGRRRDMVGLDEAVLELRHGSKAKVILPSNLAYGIGGDGDRITQSAVLVLDVAID